MLGEAEKRAIETVMGHYPTRRAACVEALKLVQKERRWISDEALKDVAALLEMSPAELDNVATFYNLIFRRPVGRHVILLCDSVSCWITGYHAILDGLRDRLGIGPGETTADDRFTLLPMACLGVCERAPALMIDEDLHVQLTLEKLEGILEDYS
jgi:NADH-quinone oxidoreductase subunit E